MLSHSRVEVVLYHHHYGRSLARAGRILVDVAGIHLIIGTEAVHVYAAIVAEFLSELLSELGMEFLGEVAKGITHGQPAFILA